MLYENTAPHVDDPWPIVKLESGWYYFPARAFGPKTECAETAEEAERRVSELQGSNENNQTNIEQES